MGRAPFLPKKPHCTRCEGPYEGWHVCFDASKRVEGEGLVEVKVSRRKTEVTASSVSAQDRWARYREEMRPRDEKIIESYVEGGTLVEVAERFGISHQTVMKILKREEEDTGRTIRRPVGVNRRFQKEVHGGFN